MNWFMILELVVEVDLVGKEQQSTLSLQKTNVLSMILNSFITLKLKKCQ